tara:strand:+ start:4073 stop:5722 length:1650 start_codon:yes stop_codon:yes gene_type:complete
MTTKKKELIVTSALPYANGPLHFGHLLEHIQTDIWVRSQRILGKSCIYLCASDSHGTPIMMKADEENISPEKLVDKYMNEHKRTLNLFQVNHDCYYQTHSEENKKYSELIYKNALNNGYISKKKIKQLFDEEKNLFLADRYVQGGCPKCNEPNQYGDNCDVCGAKYEATELKNPISIFSKKTPIIKESEHIFFNLKDLEQEIKTWIDESSLQESVNNKLQEWFKDGLMDWDISRDAPYFGFKIPGYEDKFFYVWLDAPIGYIGTLEKFLKDTNSNDSAKDLWDKDSSHEIYHFIGKDILNFHALFWPALLHAADFKKPSNVFVHGFLTLNGKKMSKSKGNFLLADQYSAELDSDYLRYYLASKLTNKIDDIDFDLKDFQKKVNTDLVGKFINIASRVQKFLKVNDNKLGSDLEENLLDVFIKETKLIFEDYENLDYSNACKRIMKLADSANQYIDHNQPWVLAKEKINEKEVIKISSTGMNLFRILNICLEPIIPKTTSTIKEYLNLSEDSFEKVGVAIKNHEIQSFKPLIKRIEDNKIEKLIEASKSG